MTLTEVTVDPGVPTSEVGKKFAKAQLTNHKITLLTVADHLMRADQLLATYAAKTFDATSTGTNIEENNNKVGGHNVVWVITKSDKGDHATFGLWQKFLAEEGLTGKSVTLGNHRYLNST
mgnify:CR=1 FL=1